MVASWVGMVAFRVELVAFLGGMSALWVQWSVQWLNVLSNDPMVGPMVGSMLQWSVK